MWTETNSEKGKSDKTMTREEAIAILGKYKRYAESIYTNDVLDTKAFDMAIEALQDRPHGEWIEAYASEFEHTAKLAVCSECDWYAGYIAKDYNFCPNCGARMENTK